MTVISRVSWLLAALLGWSAPSLAAPQVIRVGVSGSAPFVISDSDGLEGISIQIWEETASRLDRPFVYVPQPNSKANIEAVGQGDVDLAIGPISITPDRLANPKIDFTQIWYKTNYTSGNKFPLGARPAAFDKQRAGTHQEHQISGDAPILR